jgi:hypothetical protein
VRAFLEWIAHALNESLAGLFETDVEGRQHLSGSAWTFRVQQCQEDVIRAYPVMVEQSSFAAGQPRNLPQGSGHFPRLRKSRRLIPWASVRVTSRPDFNGVPLPDPAGSEHSVRSRKIISLSGQPNHAPAADAQNSSYLGCVDQVVRHGKQP